MTASPCAFPVPFRQPSVSGLSQITSSLYISSGVAANNRLMLSSNRISTVINVSVERGDEAGPHAAALRCRREPLGRPLPRLSHEVPRHVPAGRPHVDQVLPAHHPAQQRLLGAAHPL
ncbi:dual specificity protein phosphatase 18 isoform X3 [Oryx dammah]|uniref:dual specificity protein phosphatase 18 isoform X3 n=1 Tax=Oryx dammah TaxID=59534 RepID=UPI001A9B02F4|nr:dual specificity protein phosphatase 18 isoform X3 [Oryx dammah]